MGIFSVRSDDAHGNGPGHDVWNGHDVRNGHVARNGDQPAGGRCRASPSVASAATATTASTAVAAAVTAAATTATATAAAALPGVRGYRASASLKGPRAAPLSPATDGFVFPSADFHGVIICYPHCAGPIKKVHPSVRLHRSGEYWIAAASSPGSLSTPTRSRRSIPSVSRWIPLKGAFAPMERDGQKRSALQAPTRNSWSVCKMACTCRCRASSATSCIAISGSITPRMSGSLAAPNFSPSPGGQGGSCPLPRGRHGPVHRRLFRSPRYPRCVWSRRRSVLFHGGTQRGLPAAQYVAPVRGIQRHGRRQQPGRGYLPGALRVAGEVGRVRGILPPANSPDRPTTPSCASSRRSIRLFRRFSPAANTRLR